ncbi:outer membrane beta-barrel protein [soil metagenome]
MKGWLYLVFFLLPFAAISQQKYAVTGIMVDTAGHAFPGVSMKLQFGKDSLNIISDSTGAFIFPGIVADSFDLIATYTGLEPYYQTFKRPAESFVLDVGALLLNPFITDLEGVTVNAVNPIIVKEDTVQYAASAYQVREGDAVQEMVKKLPGVTVDDDGNIETNGKKVMAVRVNGKDFFGGDAQTALESLPADIVDNLQIIDDYGDQANLTGVKSGEPRKILNINVKKNKNRGNYSTYTAAVGNKGRYVGNASVNRFRDKQQITFQGTLGNTSANMKKSGGGSGITLTKTAAFNYRDTWGKKINFYGSYAFSSRNNITESNSYSQNLDPVNSRIIQRDALSNNTSINQKLNLNLEYAINQFNYLKITPNFSFSTSDNNSKSISQTYRPGYYTKNNNTTYNEGTTPNYGGAVLYNHRFNKSGRNLSINANITYNNSDQDRYSNSAYTRADSSYVPIALSDTLQTVNTLNKNTSTRSNVRVSYLEPLDSKKTTFLEFNYDYNTVSNNNAKNVFNLLDSLGEVKVFNDKQSDLYNYTFTTNKFGASIKGRKVKYNYSAGVQVQPLKLSGTSISRKFSTTYRNVVVMPSARFVYNFEKSKSLTTTIDGTSREPGFYQLQPISDSTNLENVVAGNSNLKSEFTNRLAITYNWSDRKGTNFMSNFSYDRTNNKIVTSRINNPSGTGTSTTYLNTNGFYGYNANTSFTKPFANRKYVAGISLAGNYDNNLSFTDGQKNKGNNWNFRPSASFRYDVKDRIDVTFRTSYSMFQTTTRYVNETRSAKAQTLRFDLSGRNYFNNLTIGYDYSKSLNYSYGGSGNENPSILNLSAEYRFLKKKNLTVKFQAFDIFDKYTGLQRRINASTITDVRTSRLGRFFLLSASFRVNKFAGGVKPQGLRRGSGRNATP